MKTYWKKARVRRDRKGWTKESWLAYKKWANTMTEMLLNLSKNTAAISEMMERRD